MSVPAMPPSALPSAAPRAAPTQRQAAQDFEAQALGALLQPMFEGLGSGGTFGGGAGEAQWRPMLVTEYAKGMAAAGGIGLADAVLGALQRMQEA
jgi:Rod binding domain-containing protein